MRRALDLGYRGWGRVHPNPMVGAVVLAGDEVVAEGFHAEFGGPHAEVVALTAAGDRAKGATLLVTLEPCAHAGKQAACAEAVAASGVKRVVVGMSDPNPAARGGADLLRSRGVEVEMGLLRERAERQNAVFLHSHSDAKRPFVAIKLATSLDHRIADQAGHSRWISGEEARDFVHWFRAGFDAIAVGGRTALVDDPALTVRGQVEARLPPRRVVFLGSRRLPLDSTLIRTARDIPTLVVGQPAGADASALLGHGVELVAAEGLSDGLKALWRRGIQSIVIEGGGRLAGALLAEGLVDRFAWIVSPVWIGDHGVAATKGLEVGSLMQAERWVTVDRKALGQDTLLLFDRR